MSLCISCRTVGTRPIPFHWWAVVLLALGVAPASAHAAPTESTERDSAFASEHQARTVRVAAVQTRPILFENSANLANILAQLEIVAEAGAKLAVFPELALTGYKFKSVEEALPYADTVPGSVSEAIAEEARARDVYVAYGTLEKEGLYLFDTMVLVSPTGYVGKYRKAHVGFSSEARILSRGDLGFPVFATGIGRIALGICYDGSIPETARIPALRGVDMFAFGYADGGGVSNEYLLARAEEDKAYVVAANRVGLERTVTFYGQSIIAGPGWKTLALASQDGEEIIYADLELSLLDREWLRGRRPELYGLVARPLAPQILSVDLSPQSHVFGERETLFVHAATAGIPEGTLIRLELLAGGWPVTYAYVPLEFNGMTTHLELPSDLPAGSYAFRLTTASGESVTMDSAYTVKAFQRPQWIAYLPAESGAPVKGSLYASWDVDIVPSAHVPILIEGGGLSMQLSGSINTADVDNRLSASYSGLQPESSYAVTIPADALTAAGANTGSPELSWTFTTAPAPHIVRAAIVQMSPRRGSSESNVGLMLDGVAAAAAANANVVAFPELAVSGTGFGSREEALAASEIIPGPSVDALRRKAQELGVYVAFGILEREPGDPPPGAWQERWNHPRKLYSTYVLVGPEGLVGRYRKAHLGAADPPFLSAGNSAFPTFSTLGIGNVGLLLGDDIRYPEATRVQFVQEAAIILAGSNVTDPVFMELARTRSSENRMFVLAANRVGSEGEHTFIGHSTISGGGRVILAQATDAPGLVLADLSLDSMIDKMGMRMIDRVSGKFRAISYVLDRRPELYEPLCWNRFTWLQCADDLPLGTRTSDQAPGRRIADWRP